MAGRCFTAAVALSWAAIAAEAQECRLALLLALDVSSSVDAEEDRLQRQGLAAALQAPEVRQAFFASDIPVALAAFEWSGRYNQEVVLDWVIVDSSAAIGFAAEQIASSKRSHNEFPTAMGYALGYGALMLERGPSCWAKTIDVAGDGRNNEGFLPRSAYAEFPFAGVTVNGLVINAAEFESETQLISFYEQEVLFGDGAFLEVASGFEDYERAMRRKLERELRPPSIGAIERDALHSPG